jgi:hypothetical protein
MHYPERSAARAIMRQRLKPKIAEIAEIIR